MGLGLSSSKYLSGITLLVNASIIYLVGFIGLFASVLSVNNIDIIRDNIYLNHLALGIGAACFVLSGFRFFFQMRNN